MKQYKYILYSLAVIFGAYLFTGCTKDEMIKGEEERAAEKPLLSIVAGVSETAGTRAFDDPKADPRNRNLTWLGSMTIFLFEPKSDDNSNPLLVKTAVPLSGFTGFKNRITEVVLTGKDLRDAGIALDAVVDIYAIANYVPADAAQLTKKEVMELSVPRPQYTVAGQRTSVLAPMSGVSLAYKLTSEISQKTSISLRRAIIRVNLKVVDAEYQSSFYSSEITEVKLYNDYLNTYLWNEGLTASTLCRGEAAPNTKVDSIIRWMENGILTYPNPFLGNCNEKSVANPNPTNKIMMKLTVSRTINSVETPFVYTIELKRADGTYHFERNTSLNVTITLKAKGHSTNVEVVPWGVDTETPDIDPVGIRFVDANMPTVIPKDGILDANFNFDNPAAIPFKLYMFEGEDYNGTQLNELDPDVSQQKVPITALADNPNGVFRSVSFWYQYDGIWVDTGVRAVQGEKDDPTIIQPKANTYLIAPGSESILIPVAQANDAAVPGINFGEVLTAELVWTDVRGATSGKGLSPDAAVAAIEVIGTGPEATLMVTPGSERGNAVIAVKNAAGVIKWSWHIWVTDYNAEQETGQNTSGGYIFMDRNLGAKSITPSATGVDIAGTFYQFGRKDPFPTKGSGTSFVTVYNAAGTAVIRGTGATSAEGQIRAPYTWGTSALPTGLDLWNKNGNKTVNDPCPAGWRIPPSDAWTDLNNNILPNGVAAGRAGKHTGYYPVTWMVHGNSSFWNVVLVANWTSTPSGTTNGIMLRCDTGGSVNGSFGYTRTFGNAVRCVRDWTSGKAEKEIRVFTAGMIASSKSHYLGKTAPSYGISWQEGLVPLLNTNFGQGEKVDVFFKHYSYYNGGANKDGIDYDFINLLTTYDIDVLYLPWNGVGSPTPAQAQGIIDWLDADTHRVLFMGIDYQMSLTHMQNALGLYKTLAGHTKTPAELTGDTNPIYKTLVDGKYGKITNTKFTCTYDWTYFDKDEITAIGYVPILQYQNEPNKVAMAINPNRRVVIFCDSAPFYAPSVLNSNGSLTATAKGDYPILMANTWGWIAETVKAK